MARHDYALAFRQQRILSYGIYLSDGPQGYVITCRQRFQGSLNAPGTTDGLPVEKRGLFIKRMAARLQLNGVPRLTDADLDLAVRLALQGLADAPAA
jgi:hypothetical protein